MSEDLSPHIQDAISLLAITQTDFLKIIRLQLRPDLLPSFVLHAVISTCYRYYDVTKEAPRDHFIDALEDYVREFTEDKQRIIFEYVDRVSQMQQPNKEYITSRLSDYIRSREFEVAALEFVRLVEEKKFDNAQKLMFSALRAGIEQQDLGCDYFNNFESMYRDYDDLFMMPLGIPHLDEIRGGIMRKEFVVGLGGYKGKKTWFATHIGKTALLNGLNVCHITHEVSQEEMEERYDRDVGGICRMKYKGKPIPYYRYNPRKQNTDAEMIIVPCIDNTVERKKARARLLSFGGRIFIKKFPMYQSSMTDVERYLDRLEVYENFHPDLLINDYADIMAPLNSRVQKRDQLNETYMYHKRLADERNMAVLTLSQATRSAIRAKRLKMGDFAEDIRKLANVDTAYGICQTTKQAKTSLATVYVIAARQGDMDTGCGVVMNVEAGHFCTESFELPKGVIVSDEDEDENKHVTEEEE